MIVERLVQRQTSNEGLAVLKRRSVRNPPVSSWKHRCSFKWDISRHDPAVEKAKVEKVT